jgi:hypothetical protein
MKTKTTYGFSARRLARLLAVGLRRDQRKRTPRRTSRPEEVLQELLDSEPAFDLTGHHPLHPARNSTPQRTDAAVQSVRNILLDSETKLSLVEALKDYAKELVSHSASTPETAASKVVYYAAIASALAFQERKITGLSWGELQKAYAELEQESWIPFELRSLFQKARTLCNKRSHDADGEEQVSRQV